MDLKRVTDERDLLKNSAACCASYPERDIPLSKTMRVTLRLGINATIGPGGNAKFGADVKYITS